jgi:N-acetylmuramoyl-L-alanine amidase
MHAMSSNPFTSNTGLSHSEGQASATRATPSSSLDSPVLGFEALQALLAFSSLQEQIRQRRMRELGESAEEAPSSWTAEPFDLDEVLQLVAERALSITGANGIAIALAEEGEVICRASAGPLAPPRGAHLDPESGFSASCLRSRQIVRCDDAEHDARVNLDVCRTLGIQSMVAVPLLEGETVCGLIEAFASEPYAFNDGDIRSLNLLAELVLAARKPEESLARASFELDVYERPPKAPVDFPPPMPSIEELQSALQIHRAEASFYDSTHDEQSTILEDYDERQKLPSAWILVVLIVALALLTGAGTWWKLHSQNALAQAERSPDPTQLPDPTIAPASPAPSSAPLPLAAAPAEEDRGANVPPLEPSVSVSRVTGIRHWSSTDSSTVVIDLQDHVQYEAHRLTDPERIYFDLHDTTVGHDLENDLEIADALLVRVRVAQPSTGITRVVLETKGSPSFSVSLEPSPYRLVIEVHPVGTAAKPRAKVDLFAPVNPDESASLADVVRPQPSRPAAAGKLRIALDAGHGGWDLGTVGRSGLLEKDLVLDIVARLGRLVEKRMHAEVIYTRQDDAYVSLERRTELANLAQADFFVSVHANYSDLTTAQGVETYYTNTYSSAHAMTVEARTGSTPLDVDWTNVNVREKVLQSRLLAEDVQRSLYHTLSKGNPTVRDRGVKQASYVVLTGTTMPAILAEVSFVSSPSDESHLLSPNYREQIAEALYKGIAGYKKPTKRINLASASGRPSGE